jgi:signal peptidase
MNRQRRKGLVVGIAGCVLLAGTWVLLAPPQGGGRTRYVDTIGISMRPGIHAGDLVFVRQQRRYQVGHVVAYHSRVLNTTVLHRIVGRDGDTFITKGDSNPFVDADRPRPGDILGEEWLLVPGVGNILGWFRHPGRHAGLLAGLLVLAVGGGLTAAAARRRRRRGRRVGAGAPRLGHAAALAAPQGLAIALGAALLSIALGGVAYSRPVTRAGKVSYTQRGQFDYTAQVPIGPVYEQPRLTTGDPIFLRLVPRLDVSLDYRFTAAGRYSVRGTATMRTQLAATSGWMRSLPTAPTATFEGNYVHVDSSIDPAQIRSIVAQVEAATGITGGTYTVSIVPDVHVIGSVAGQPVTDQFSSPLVFRFRPDQLVLEQPSAVQAAKTATVDVPGAERVRILILGSRIDVALARWISAIGAALALLGAAVAGAVVTRRHPDEPARIHARYRRWLIPVERLDNGPKGHIVEVASIDALMRLANRYDRMVLVRHYDGVGDAYVVEDDGIQFLYRSGGARPSPEGRHSMNGDFH